jgi:hypothetical protein
VPARREMVTEKPLGWHEVLLPAPEKSSGHQLYLGNEQVRRPQLISLEAGCHDPYSIRTSNGWTLPVVSAYRRTGVSYTGVLGEIHAAARGSVGLSFIRQLPDSCV